MHVEDAQLPYCLTSWPELDGRQVLFNRNYEPIWQRVSGCPAVPANPEERTARWGNDYFYDECNSPPKRPDPWRSKKTRQILETVLAEFIAGRDVRFGIYRLWLGITEAFPSKFYYTKDELPQGSSEPTLDELHPEVRPRPNLVFGLVHVLLPIASVLLSAWPKLPINPPAPPSWS